MKNQLKSKSNDGKTLRQKAELQLKKKISDESAILADGDLAKLFHELQVHQIELELQNEELKLAKEKTEEATEKFTELYDSAPTGYFTLDTEGEILSVNLRGASMLNKERLYLVTRNFKLYVSDDSLPVFNNFLNDVFNTSSNHTCEVKLKDNESTSIYVYMEAKLPEDKQTCFITMVDIADRKIAEQKLEQYNSRIKELYAAKEKLYSIIAHDLRSPFTGILGLSKLLIENIHIYDIEESKEYIKHINDSANNTLILLDNLLIWIKLQTRKTDFTPEIILLQPVLQEIVEGLNSSAIIKNIELNYFHPDHIVVYSDKNMLKTVLRNLVSNAIKFSDSGGMVEIKAVSDQNQTKISISDNGVGMNEETISKLFRTDTTQTTLGTANESGSGLGLILCKEFVEMHGGKIWVESVLGKGSNFYFTICTSSPQTLQRSIRT